MIDVHYTILDFQSHRKNHDLSTSTLELFKQIIKDYYKKNRRSFPWRDHIDPYHVVVSEIMLQQTQTKRVLQKFTPFIERFPSFQALASAPLHDVLAEWSGLGYNRRGIALHEIAKKITFEFDGKLPLLPAILKTFPGIGSATSCSIVAFAYNLPTVFIETNIRSVFIHFFFPESSSIDDTSILELVGKTLEQENPREWYYALMDYGVLLKMLYANPSRKSKHYTKQSPFEGSNRQIRSTLLKILLHEGTTSSKKIADMTHIKLDLVEKNLQSLEKEGFITHNNDCYSIKK